MENPEAEDQNAQEGAVRDGETSVRKAGGSVLREDDDGWGQVDVEENWGVTGKAGFFSRMFLVCVDTLKFRMEHLGNV